jgi:hypothetical protein
MSGPLIDHNSKFNSKGLAVTDTACHRNVAVHDLSPRDLQRVLLQHMSTVTFFARLAAAEVDPANIGALRAALRSELLLPDWVCSCCSQSQL